MNGGDGPLHGLHRLDGRVHRSSSDELGRRRADAEAGPPLVRRPFLLRLFDALVAPDDVSQMKAPAFFFKSLAARHPRLVFFLAPRLAFRLVPLAAPRARLYSLQSLLPVPLHVDDRLLPRTQRGRAISQRLFRGLGRAPRVRLPFHQTRGLAVGGLRQRHDFIAFLTLVGLPRARGAASQFGRDVLRPARALPRLLGDQ
mmetsp:Transcript_2860/g.8586  ORF Transcript_2860/g.8586 Transcript_2860/m.8586 type:complete len:200 (-) Transcript_2860:102-701(-)